MIVGSRATAIPRRSDAEEPMRTTTASTLTSAAIATLALGLGGCVASEDTTEQASALARNECHNPNPALFPFDARPFGRSMEDWAEAWWQWSYSIPLPLNPNDTATADPGANQRGPVYFLATTPVDGRTFDVPHHKAIGVLLSSILNDYPCPDPTFQPPPGQTLFDFLSQGAAD